MALAAKVPHLERVSIVVEYQPPDRRRRDADNPAPSAKACIDGIVAAGVLTDDACPRYVTEIRCTIGEQYPRGRLVLQITEVRTELGESA
jgi:Holliday junction resolvase RusA-like endonuclease